MKISNIIQINLNKLRKRKLKALFLILPVTLLMVLTLVVSSQVKNFKNASEQSIFGTVDNQATLINIEKVVEFNASNPQSFLNTSNEFTSSDLDKIRQISNVTSATLNSQIPISNIKTTDLFDKTTYQINNLVELDSESASLYTEENFTYTEGQPIPIILNASSFIEQYEDWGGKDSVEVTFTRGSNRPGSGSTTPPSQNDLGTPLKTRNIEYSKDDLIGKTFTVNVGGLDAIASYKTEQSAGVLKFTKLTEEEILAKETERNTALSKYWNYEELKTPLTYTFQVVGIIEDASNNRNYLPTEFADLLVQQYIQKQLDSRNSTEFTTSELNSTYRGMTYDGTQLNSDNLSGPGGRMIRQMAPGGMGGPGTGNNSNTSTSYTVPGLVIELSAEGNQTVVGSYTNTNVYSESVKKGQSISIKINSVNNRTQVVEDLNKAGFAYQDLNNLEVFASLRSTLDKVSKWLTIAFVIITIAVVVFAMSKFVSESRKEIGIFRAIGMKKSTIIYLFTSQAVIYTAVGYILGVGIGFLINLFAAGAMHNWFDTLITNTVQESYNVVNQVDSALFRTIDFTTLGIYSITLLALTLVIGFLPAFKASSISPIEAIKSE